MSKHDEVLSDFIDAWNAGRRPSVRDHLARVPAGAERDELAARLTTWLEVAPTPGYSDETRAAIREEPVVRHVLAAVGEDAGAWPAVLPRLRERAGLGVRELARRVVDALSLGAPDAEQRTAGYLERLERGELRADRVSRRLVRGLAEALGVSGDALAGLGGTALRPAAPSALLFRADEDATALAAQDIDVLSRAAMAPPPPPMDEVDRLFCGGPDA